MDESRKKLLDKIEKKVIPIARECLDASNFENYDIKDVFHYKQEIELINKETKQKEKFYLYAVQTENDEGVAFELECFENEKNKKIFTINDLIKEYEGFEDNIRDVVNKAKEKDTLNELKKEREHDKKSKEAKENKTKENDEEEISTFKTDKVGATSLDQMIDGVTLRNILKLNGDYECIKPVSASKIRGYTEEITSKDAIVAIKRNGECKILDETIIRQDRQEGNNSFDKDLNINNDGSVEYKSNTSSYQIVNRPNYYISIGYDEGTSKKEIKLSKRSGREGDREVEFELHKYGAAEYEESDTRKLRQENEDGIEKSEVIDDKQKAHEKLGCENENVENIDNYEENDIQHINPDDIIEGTRITWKQFADMCEYSGEDAIEKAHKEFIENKKQNPELNNQEIVEKIADEKQPEEIEEDYERFREGPWDKF